jgi:hypothetical protein
MDVALKTSAGEIIKTSGGKVIKVRKFSETVIQDGLQFWGVAQPDKVTLVDGLVSELYDVRDNNLKVIQPTVSSRPGFYNNKLIFSGIKQLYATNQNVSSMFMVFSGGSLFYIYAYSTYKFGKLNYMNYYVNNVAKDFYADLTKTTSILNNTLKSFHTLYDFNVINATLTIGGYGSTTNVKLHEFGWYDRVLNETEVLYNQNALMTKYNLS